uniref:Uncharacterized protein n=1 Tax=Klebsiella pneumoniae TaxID=573 RepID=A0A8B0SVW2_KLEPN|nr:hypothetical protein [Klebsiella pneumoniae]
MKVTEPGLNTLIDNLNTLICEDSLLTRRERETPVRAVAAIGAMKARVSMKKRRSADRCQTGKKGRKKDRQPDPRFSASRSSPAGRRKKPY